MVCGGGGSPTQTTPAVTESLEVSLLYIRFRTQLSHVQPLMALIHKRAERRRYVGSGGESALSGVVGVVGIVCVCGGGGGGKEAFVPAHPASCTGPHTTHPVPGPTPAAPPSRVCSIADTALDCYASYLDHRRGVVSQVVLAKLESLKAGKDVLALVRRARAQRCVPPPSRSYASVLVSGAPFVHSFPLPPCGAGAALFRVPL